MSAENNLNLQITKKEQENGFKLEKKKFSKIKMKKISKTKLYSNIDLKHIVNVGDICFINEHALRYPDTSEETLLKSLYHYNVISKVTLNNQYVKIELKKNYQSILPPQYFIDRFRSLGDRQLSALALKMEKINQQFSMIRQAYLPKETMFSKEKQEEMLQKFIQSHQGKKYLVFFSQISPQKITLKNMIFSVPLLQAIGWNIENIALDFLKYKHVFFQIFTAKNYGRFLEGCFEGFFKIQAKLMQNPNITQEEKRQLTQMIYEDQIIRRQQTQLGIYEQINKVKVLWYCPHPSICYFEIKEIKDAENTPTNKRIRTDLLDKTNPEQENYQLFKRIDIDCSSIKIENESHKEKYRNNLKELGNLKKFSQSSQIYFP